MNFRKRRKGFALLIATVATAGVIGILGLSLTEMHNASFNTLSRSEKVYQAQLYALDQANLLRVTDYNDIIAEDKRKIGDSKYYRETLMTVGLSDDAKYNVKKLVINVYYGDNNNILATFELNIYKRIQVAPPSI